MNTHIDLYDQLQQVFDTESLKEFCFLLQVKYEELPGDRLSSRIRSLIQLFERENQLDELVHQFQQHMQFKKTPYSSPSPSSSSIQITGNNNIVGNSNHITQTNYYHPKPNGSIDNNTSQKCLDTVKECVQILGNTSEKLLVKFKQTQHLLLTNQLSNTDLKQVFIPLQQHINHQIEQSSKLAEIEKLELANMKIRVLIKRITNSC